MLDSNPRKLSIVFYNVLEGLGFNIRGGVDMPHLPDDHGIFVTRVRSVGAAAVDGRLAEGDKILKVRRTSES